MIDKIRNSGGSYTPDASKCSIFVKFPTGDTHSRHIIAKCSGKRCISLRKLLNLLNVKPKEFENVIVDTDKILGKTIENSTWYHYYKETLSKVFIFQKPS